MFTQEELKNMKVLVLRSQIKGDEAVPVAELIKKLDSLITNEEVTATKPE